AENKSLEIKTLRPRRVPRDSTLLAWYPFLYAPRAGGAHDSHHRTAGIAGRIWRRGVRVAARGARAADAGHRRGESYETSRDRRHVMHSTQSRRGFLTTLSSVGAVSLIGARDSLAQEQPPEITTIRFARAARRRGLRPCSRWRSELMPPSPKRSRSGCDPLARFYARCGSSPLSTLGIDDHRGDVGPRCTASGSSSRQETPYGANFPDLFRRAAEYGDMVRMPEPLSDNVSALLMAAARWTAASGQPPRESNCVVVHRGDDRFDRIGRDRFIRNSPLQFPLPVRQSLSANG